MNRNELSLLLRAAIARHATAELLDLFLRHGVVAFAHALAPWSARAIADALSVLPPPARIAVWRHLTAQARRELRAAGRVPLDASDLGATPAAAIASAPSPGGATGARRTGGRARGGSGSRLAARVRGLAVDHGVLGARRSVNGRSARK